MLAERFLEIRQDTKDYLGIFTILCFCCSNRTLSQRDVLLLSRVEIFLRYTVTLQHNLHR